jgi:hypothetical protein
LRRILGRTSNNLNFFSRLGVAQLLYKYNFNDISKSGKVIFPESSIKFIKDLEEAMAKEAAMGGGPKGHH